MFGKSHKEIKEKIVKKTKCEKNDNVFIIYLVLQKEKEYCIGKFWLGYIVCKWFTAYSFFVVSEDKSYRSKQRKEDKLIKILREIDFLFIVKNIKK